MATGAQLDQYDRLEKKHRNKVAMVKKGLKQALSRAKAQLAVALTEEGLLAGSVDITQREGFDPDNPIEVLSVEERRRLPDATLVVDALRDYMDLTLRLQNQRGPRVSGRGVTGGSI